MATRHALKGMALTLDAQRLAQALRSLASPHLTTPYYSTSNARHRDRTVRGSAAGWRHKIRKKALANAARLSTFFVDNRAQNVLTAAAHAGFTAM